MDAKLLAIIIPAASAITAVTMNYFHSKSILKEKKRSERKKSIAKRLNDFYGPVISYLEVTKGLFKIFRRDKPPGFRTLTFVLNPEQLYDFDNKKEKVVLTDTDKTLLNEIVEISKTIEEIILSNAGLVNDKTLMFDYVPDPTITDVKLKGIGLLPAVIIHFRVIRLAYEGKLQGDVERFKNYVYPDELDIKLKHNFNELQEEFYNLSK